MAIIRNSPKLNNVTIQVENPRTVLGLFTEEFSQLKPELIKFYLETKRKGMFLFAALLFSYFRNLDLKIGGEIQKRKLASVTKQWTVEFKTESDVPDSIQEETVDFINENLSRLNMTELIGQIVEAQIQGVKGFELNFDMEGSKTIYRSIRSLPNYLLMYDDQAGRYYVMDATKCDVLNLRMQALSDQMSDRINVKEYALTDIDERKLMFVESIDGDSENGFMNGAIDSLIMGYYFKNYGIKDWAIFLERFASPGVVGKKASIMSPDDSTAFENAVKKFYHLWSAVIPQGADISLLTDQNKGASGSLYESFAGYFDKAIAQRINGNTLTSDIGDVGSKAAAQVHKQVQEEIVIADMSLAADKINYLIKLLLDLNGWAEKEYPKFAFAVEYNIDYIVSRSTILKNVFDSGWVTTADDIKNEFGFEVEPRQATPQPTPAQFKAIFSEDGDWIPKWIKSIWDKKGKK